MMRTRVWTILLILGALAAPALAAPHPADDSELSARIIDTLTLRYYNTRIVILGVTSLGLAAGVAGTSLLLRKRSLTADALAHATLPGVALAFIVIVSFGGSGRNMTGLLIGAFLSGLVGMAWLIAIRNTTRLKDDAALGIVLSVMFGLGVALIKIAEYMPAGSAAGLDRFIMGKAANMLAAEAWTILIAALVITALGALVFKELKLLCFDRSFGSTQGWPTGLLDAILMALVLGVTVIGLQSVGLLLVVALLIIPAAAARFWTERLGVMTVTAALIGAVSGYVGAFFSALSDQLPTGPIIVLACAAAFAFSLVFGARRGLLIRITRHLTLARRVGAQHLLRAVYEVNEAEQGVGHVSQHELLAARSWSPGALRRLIGRAVRKGLLRRAPDHTVALTQLGRTEARRVVRNHRLWEMYLIQHADIAPSHVDRDADTIEHILAPDMIDRLETLLAEQFPHIALPTSPHPITHAAGSAEVRP